MRLESGEERKPLFEKDLPLPESLNWEQMEAGILDRMEAKKPFYAKPIFRWLGLTLGLIVLGMLVVQWPGQDEFPASRKPGGVLQETQMADESIGQTDHPSIRQNSRMVMPNAPGGSTPSSGQSISTSTTLTSESPVGLMLQEVPVSKSQERDSDGQQPAFPGRQPTGLVELSLKTVAPSLPLPLEDREQAVVIDSTTGVALTSIVNGLKLSSSVQYDAPELIPAVVSPITRLNHQPYFTQPKAASISPAAIESKPFKRSQRQWRLLLQTGLNAFNNGYEGANQEIVDLRRSTEHFDPGNQFEIRLERRLSDRLFIGSGLGMHTYRRVLDAEAPNNFRRLYTDVLLSYNENPITGEISNQVYADTLLRVTQLRKIKHYNSYQSWEIPLYLGYSWQRGRWQYATTAGLSASFNRKLDGRVFDADAEVGTLGQELFLRYDNKVSVAWLLEGRISYRLFHILDLHAGLGHQRFIGNWMTNSNNALNSKPKVWRANLGASIRL